MEPWFADAIRESDPPDRLLLVRRRRAVTRLRELDLRDRWGYPLEPRKLAAIAEYVVLNLDHEAAAQRKKAPAAVAEIVDRLATEMFTGDLPMFCDGYDTPPSDETIETVVRTILTEPRSS